MAGVALAALGWLGGAVVSGGQRFELGISWNLEYGDEPGSSTASSASPFAV